MEKVIKSSLNIILFGLAIVLLIISVGVAEENVPQDTPIIEVLADIQSVGILKVTSGKTSIISEETKSSEGLRTYEKVTKKYNEIKNVFESVVSANASFDLVSFLGSADLGLNVKDTFGMTDISVGSFKLNESKASSIKTIKQKYEEIKGEIGSNAGIIMARIGIVNYSPCEYTIKQVKLEVRRNNEIIYGGFPFDEGINIPAGSPDKPLVINELRELPFPTSRMLEWIESKSQFNARIASYIITTSGGTKSWDLNSIVNDEGTILTTIDKIGKTTKRHIVHEMGNQEADLLTLLERCGISGSCENNENSPVKKIVINKSEIINLFDTFTAANNKYVVCIMNKNGQMITDIAQIPLSSRIFLLWRPSGEYSKTAVYTKAMISPPYVDKAVANLPLEVQNGDDIIIKFRLQSGYDVNRKVTRKFTHGKKLIAEGLEYYAIDNKILDDLERDEALKLIFLKFNNKTHTLFDIAKTIPISGTSYLSGYHEIRFTIPNVDPSGPVKLYVSANNIIVPVKRKGQIKIHDMKYLINNNGSDIHVKIVKWYKKRKKAKGNDTVTTRLDAEARVYRKALWQ